jgi:type IV pilus assembly protein PilN
VLTARWRGFDKLRITLNLATRPFADLGPAIKRLRIAMAAMAVVAIGLGLGLHALHNKSEIARARDHSLDGQIGRISQEREGYQAMMRKPDNAKLLDQSVALNHMFDDKSFSWTVAMEELETVLPGQVMVQNLEPIRAKDGHITLHLRVAGPRNLSVNLVRNLEHSRHFILPRIVGETSEAQEGGPNRQMEPVSESNRFDFDLLADYNPGVPVEHKAKRPAKTEDGGATPAVGADVPPGAHAKRVFPGPHKGPDKQKAVPPKPQLPKPNPSIQKTPGGIK